MALSSKDIESIKSLLVPVSESINKSILGLRLDTSINYENITEFSTVIHSLDKRLSRIEDILIKMNIM